MRTRQSYSVFMIFLLSGCAGFRFGEGSYEGKNAIGFYSTVPGLAVKTAGDCAISIDAVNIPGEKRYVHFKNGWGSAKLSVAFVNGQISTINQETDSKGPETITALGGLPKDLVGLMSTQSQAPSGTCEPHIQYLVWDGEKYKDLGLVLKPYGFKAVGEAKAQPSPAKPDLKAGLDKLRDQGSDLKENPEK